ncbi:glucosamine-6-phosphate deaminase [Isosphaeraceae bacterium EP7]
MIPLVRELNLMGATIQVYHDAATASLAAAEQIARLTDEARASRGSAVLGLATGSTPIPVYEHLVDLTRAGKLAWEGVSTYNLDEYYPMSPVDPNSYRWFMHRHLFSLVNLPANQAHVLDGTVPEAFAAQHAADYDRWIDAAGGLDLQLLGIGRNGHIGFNEPTDLSAEVAAGLPTRMVDLHPTTSADAAKDFGGKLEKVPRRALTMGIGPILAARSILILAFGPNKADAVRKSLVGPVTAEVPASLLQTVAGKVTWMLDEAAAAQL